MQENSNIINLGNLQTGGIPVQGIPTTNEAVAPVSDLNINSISISQEISNQTQVSISHESNELIQTQPEQLVAPAFTQVESQPIISSQTSIVEPKAEEKKLEEKTDYDILIVKTSILKNMLDNVLNFITYDNRFEISTITQLIFSSKGLEIKSANGIEAYIYQKNFEWTYSAVGEYSFCIDSQILQRLVTKITAPYITFERSAEDSKIIIIKAGTGEYKLPEKLDPGSGETINIESPVSFDDVNSIPLVNYDKFKVFLNKCLPFAAEPGSDPVFTGVYCNDDFIAGSNSTTLCITDSIPELKGATIFIPKDLVKKIIAVNISGKIDIAWKITEGKLNPSMIKIHSENIEDKSEIIVTGMLQEDDHYASFPIDAVKLFKQMEFGQTFTASRNELKEALDRTSLFFQMTDQNQVKLSITPNNMNIKSLSGGSDENIKIENCTQPLNVLRMDATQINLMLDNLSSNIVTMKADNDNNGLMSITDEDSLIILSEVTGA